MTAKDLVASHYEDVELKVSEIINSNEPLQRISTTPFAPILSFKIAKTLRTLDEVTERFSKTRKEILDRLGKLDPKTKKYVFEGENEKTATDEVNELLAHVETVNILKVKITELGNTPIEARVIAALHWYFVE